MDASDFPRTTSLEIDLTVLGQTASTNQYLVDNLGPDNRVAVVVTDHQTSGRGRQGRQWVEHPGGGLALSVFIPAKQGEGWLSAFPLLVGGVVADVLADECGVVVSLKWPNDVLIAGKKVAGILCESVTGGVIAGIGLNTTYPENALPTVHATSLHLHTRVDDTFPDRFIHGIVNGLDAVVKRAEKGDGDALVAEVSKKIVTIGQPVRVEFPNRTSREGVATGIGPDGSLRVSWSGGDQGVVVAGDVWHLTPLA